MREIIVKLAEFLGLYQWLMKLDTKYQMQKQNKAFAKYGLETLSAAESAAKEAGCQLFLAFGSLLGAYREKGFIPFDCDLDTGMVAKERTDEFVESMQRHGLTLLRQYYVKATGRICEDKFEYKGVHLDVHYFYPDDAGNLCCVSDRSKEPHKVRHGKYLFPCEGKKHHDRKPDDHPSLRQCFVNIKEVIHVIA